MKNLKLFIAFCLCSMVVSMFMLTLICFFDFFIIFPDENNNTSYVTQSAKMSKHDIMSLNSQNVVCEFKQETQDTQGTETKNIETIIEHESQQNKKYIGTFLLTAYCSCEKCCGKYAENRPVDENGNKIVYGATGQRLYQGISIAVDPSVISYGSKVLINGKEYVAHDCGGKIRGNRIDVFFENHDDAKQFGTQTHDVYILTS